VDSDKEMLMSQMNFEKRFGQSAAFVTSTLMEEGGVPPSSSPAALLKDWGLEVKALNETIDFPALLLLSVSVMNCNACSLGGSTGRSRRTS
jgi:hypothetical protein